MDMRYESFQDVFKTGIRSKTVDSNNIFGDVISCQIFEDRGFDVVRTYSAAIDRSYLVYQKRGFSRENQGLWVRLSL